MIYFIQSTSGGLIKIGLTDSVARRMSQLRSGRSDDLALLATMPGGRAEERKLHRQFATSRHRGEWFAPTPELLALIKATAEQEIPPEPVPLAGPKVDRQQEIDLAAMFGQFLEQLFGPAPEGVRPVAELAGSSPAAAQNWVNGKNFPGGLYLLKMVAQDRRIARWVQIASKAADLAAAEKIDLPTAFKVTIDRPAMMLAGLP